MATAAFKSSSRRSNSDKAPPKRRPQRSLSVSAVSRRSESDIDSDFLNKRDNPLFSTNKEGQCNNDDDDADVNINLTVGQRGRSISRNLDNRRKNGVGRSLSRGPSASEVRISIFFSLYILFVKMQSIVVYILLVLICRNVNGDLC